MAFRTKNHKNSPVGLLTQHIGLLTYSVELQVCRIIVRRNIDMHSYFEYTMTQHRHVFYQSFSIYYNERTLFESLRKSCGHKMFSYIWGDKLLWGELQLNGGSNICCYSFIISFLKKQATPRKVMHFFKEFLNEM